MKKILQSVVIKRMICTIGLLFIFVVGTIIPLPFVDIDSPRFLGGSLASLAFSTALMGGNLNTLSIFSIGISPWMSTILIWQMFTLSRKGMGSLPENIQDRRKMYITFVVALIQALAVTLTFPVKAGYNPFTVTLLNTLILIAGTFFLVWLSDINSLLGLGGPMMIMMAGMMISMPQNIARSVQVLKIGWNILIPLFILGVVFLYISSLTFRARYRIPVNKISIHNRFKKYSYIDIPINPSNGMPFMYAMTFVNLPQYVLLLLQSLFPGAKWIPMALNSILMGTVGWLVLYLVILTILSIAFSFVNVNGAQMAARMKKSGEYIYDVYPGEDTSKLINKTVLRFAVFGAFYSLIMGGFPLLVTLVNPQYLQLSMIPGMFLIFSGMIFNVKEEMTALTLNENYLPLM